MAIKLKYNQQLILTAIILSAVFFTVPSLATAQIIINEIMYDLAGTDDKHEWIEIYNNGSADVDLTDWKLNDGDTATNHALNAPPKNAGLGSMILGANEYCLLAGDAATLSADLPNYNGTIIDTVLSLSNTGAALKLLDKDGIESFSISYNKDLGAAGNGKSLEWDGAALKESLVNGGTPGKINSVLSSSVSGAAPSDSPAPTASAEASPAPTAINYQYSQKVLLNEFLVWPEDNEKEWVELINLENSSINLSGWQIDDADNSTAPQIIPADTIISANGFLVVSSNKSTLNNDGDKVRLLWPDGQVVHSVSYAKAAQGQAVAKFDSGWLWTNQPTPGQANKKSFFAVNEKVANDLSNKITALEESAATNTTPRPLVASKQKTATQISSSPENAPLATPETAQPDLLAAAAKNSTNNYNNLALVGILFLAGLSALGLIYWRRQKQVDMGSPDD